MLKPEKILESAPEPSAETNDEEKTSNNKRKLGAALPDWLADKNDSGKRNNYHDPPKKF
jgi:hypothetical protein